MIHAQRPPVVIVGAGPAGCATAIALARRGIEVVVLERGRFPRDKVCGDVLLPSARAALEAMGVDAPEIARGAHHIDRCRYVTPSGQAYELPFEDLSGQRQPWWVIRRERFDARLVEQTRAAGAEVREGWSVQDLLVRDNAFAGVRARFQGESRTLEAAVVVGADGAGSVVARAAGLHSWSPSHLCVALRGYAVTPAADSSAFSLFTTRRTLPGCGWLVPTGDGHVNVGVGVLSSTLQRFGVRPRDLLDELAQRHPQLAEPYRDVARLAGWSLPGASLPRQRWRPGLLLVGDAGGMVDPFTGHGIHTALRGGLLAGQVLARALAKGVCDATILAQYDDLWRREWALEMRLGWLLQRLCASAWRVEHLLRYVNSSAALRSLVGGLVGHAYPRRALLRASAWFRQAATAESNR